MLDTKIDILFEEDRSHYEAGAAIAGQFLVTVPDVREIKAVEVSILWYTEGKGDEDLVVHHFERIDAQDGSSADLRRPLNFQTRLPNSPLSYRGAIVRIVWCVRVRVYPLRGEDVMAEERFQLGTIPAAVVSEG